MTKRRINILTDVKLVDLYHNLSSSNDVIPSTTNPLTSSPLEEEERKRKRKLDNSIQSEEEEEGKESHKEMAIVIL